jgi:hypothetical protein
LSKKHDTTLGESDLFDQWRSEAGFKKGLTKRLSTDWTLFYGVGRYDQLNTSEELTGCSMMFKQELHKDVFFTTGYTISSVKSKDDAREYLRNVVSVRLSALY